MGDRKRALGVAVLLAALLLVVVSWREEGAPVPEPPAEQAEKPARGASAAPVTDDDDVVTEAPRPAEAPRDAIAEPPPGVPSGSARCHLLPAVTGVGHLVVGDPAEVPYDGRLVTLTAGEAVLPWIEERGFGVLAVEGYAPVEVTWSDGACQPDPIVLAEGDAWVAGTVSNAEGEPEGKVFVEGCGNQARTDADGSYAMAVVPGRCVLNAFRRDGLLFASAQAAEIEPVAGEELVVDFALPELPRAGLGVVIEQTPDGIRILDVLEGTAAADVGLGEGDLVVEVDGTPTAGIALEDFIGLAVGPVGTDVEVVVLRAGVEERLTLDRRELKGG